MKLSVQKDHNRYKSSCEQMHKFMSTINRWFCLVQHAQCTSLYFLKVRRGARITRGYDQCYDIIAKTIEYVPWG